MIAEQVPEGGRRGDALKRIEHRLDSAKPLEGEDDMATVWETQARSPLDTVAYEKHLAGIWQETGCAAEGAPYVLRGLLLLLEYRNPFGAQSPQPRELAKAFLDEAHCPGARAQGRRGRGCRR